MRHLIILAFFAAGLEVQAQSLADVARAERERQRAVEARLALQEFGDAHARDVGEEEAETSPATASAEDEQETDKEISLDQKLQNARVDLIKKRSELLMLIDQYRDDPEAVKAMEAQLMELSKHAEALKLQYLDTIEPQVSQTDSTD